MFFSLPGDSESSGNEAESSDSDFVPEIAPAESSQESDNIDTQPTRKRKRLQRKKRKSKQPADASELRDEGSDKSEAEEVEPSLWSTSEPLNIVRSPKIWDPQFSSKVPTNAAEAFALYFTDDLLDVIIEHTNREGARKYGRKWSVLSMQELKAYFGMLLLMSVSPRHHLYHYWSRDGLFHSPEISRVMTFRRFQNIMNSLHMNDRSKEKKRGDEGYDRLVKVRLLIDALNKSFQAEYTPSPHQAIDESMIPFKGRSTMKQYLPLKPIKRGYKVWCRADSKTGYLLEFQVYEGKNANRPSDLGLGEHVVLSLSSNIQPGSQLYFDNYFTSTRLMEGLARKSILAVGTVRVNRKDLPEEIKKDNKLKKGDYIWRSKGPVTAYQWRDTKNVHVLSNFHYPEDTEVVSRKLSNGSSIGVTCPKAIADYNCWMNAVDKFDQKRNSYRTDRRSKKSWYRIFYFLFDAAVVNASIQLAASNDISYMYFRLVLGRLLINGQKFRDNTSTRPYRQQKKGQKNGQKMVGVCDEVRFAGTDHNPMEVPKRRRCRWCSTAGNEVRTKFLCTTCEVPLCATCFGPFHAKNTAK